MFFCISVVYIKEEPKDAESLVIIEPEMKPLVATKNCFNGTNCSSDEIDMKEEPLQDDLVSELYNNNIQETFDLHDFDYNGRIICDHVPISLARVYVWNTEGLHFSLDEALGFVRPSSTISNSFIGLWFSS